MRTESRVFNVVGGFLYLIAGLYAWWTDKVQTHIEWVGTVALVLSGTLAVMCGLYFGFVARRIEPRPEDRDAEIAEGAGLVGFFSPGSYWPLGIGLAAALTALGLAAAEAWLVAVGLVGVLLTVGGLLFEYYVTRARQPQP